MERFWLNEVNILAKVRGFPELLQVIDVFRCDALYIVTELYEHGDL